MVALLCYSTVGPLIYSQKDLFWNPDLAIGLQRKVRHFKDIEYLNFAVEWGIVCSLNEEWSSPTMPQNTNMEIITIISSDLVWANLHPPLRHKSAAQHFYICHYIAPFPPQSPNPTTGSKYALLRFVSATVGKSSEAVAIGSGCIFTKHRCLLECNLCVCGLCVCLCNSQPTWGEPPQGNPASVPTRLPLRAWPMSESAKQSNAA